MEQIQTNGTLHNWWVDNNMVYGEITGDTKARFSDNTFIHTSRIDVDKSDIKEGGVVVTLNSSYSLGKKSTRIG